MTESLRPVPADGTVRALERLGVQVLTIPAPTGDEKLRLEGWRDGIEKHGQDLWRIYHWLVHTQRGSTHGVYRLRDWLEQFNVPDNTNGEHWQSADD